VPIAWFDSEAASTTTDLQPYLPMLNSIVGFYRANLPANPDSDELAGFIEGLSDSDWAYLADNVPEPIAAADPSDFDRHRQVTTTDLRKVLER
jgi:hypothetical protein